MNASGPVRPILLASLLLPALGGIASAEPAVVAVFAVEGKDSKLSARTLDNLTELLSAELGAGGRFRTIPTEDLKARIGGTKADSYKTCFDQACQIEIGKELAAEKTLSTRVLRMGTVCVLTSRLFDLKTAVSERSATAESDCTDRPLMTAVRSIVDQLGRAPAGGGDAAAPPAKPENAKPENARPAAPKEASGAGAIGDLASWEVLNGTWYADSGFIYGTDGHLALRGPTPKNYRFAITAEQVAGNEGATNGIGVRSILIPGKTLRNGTTDLQCYGMNFAKTGIWSVFRGSGGTWFRVNPTEWPTSPLFQRGPNRIEWLVNGSELMVSVNGKELFRFTDGSLPFGGPIVAVHHPGNTYRYSNPVLTPLD